MGVGWEGTKSKNKTKPTQHWYAHDLPVFIGVHEYPAVSLSEKKKGEINKKYIIISPASL